MTKKIIQKLDSEIHITVHQAFAACTFRFVDSFGENCEVVLDIESGVQVAHALDAKPRLIVPGPPQLSLWGRFKTALGFVAQP